jgi:DNA polymerase III sliding clamp (beta) subunit (PCNA family)
VTIGHKSGVTAMKHVTFGAETFKKIMESCGSVVACNKDSRKVLTRICFDMENDQCTAVALDGYKLMKIIADCDMEDKAPMRVLIEPVKIPKNITTVKLHCDDKRI